MLHRHVRTFTIFEKESILTFPRVTRRKNAFEKKLTQGCQNGSFALWNEIDWIVTRLFLYKVINSLKKHILSYTVVLLLFPSICLNIKETEEKVLNNETTCKNQANWIVVRFSPLLLTKFEQFKGVNALVLTCATFSSSRVTNCKRTSRFVKIWMWKNEEKQWLCCDRIRRKARLSFEARGNSYSH